MLLHEGWMSDEDSGPEFEAAPVPVTVNEPEVRQTPTCEAENEGTVKKEIIR